MEKIRRYWVAWSGTGLFIAGGIALVVGLTKAAEEGTRYRIERKLPPRHALPDPERTGGPPTSWAVALMAGLGGGTFWFLRKTLPRHADKPDVRPADYTLSSWAFLLDRADHYERALSGLADAGDLSRPAARRSLWQRFGAEVRPEDILGAFVAFPNMSPYGARLGRTAKTLLGDLAADVASIAGTDAGDACLVLCVATHRSVERVAPGATPERLLRAWRVTGAGVPAADTVFFMRHRSLSRAKGIAVMTALRERVLSAAGSPDSS
jgi:hypothetical protein